MHRGWPLDGPYREKANNDLGFLLLGHSWFHPWRCDWANSKGVPTFCGPLRHFQQFWRDGTWCKLFRFEVLCQADLCKKVATFLCGAESFPTPLRGHFLGLAAAVGKAGAAIGTQVFTPIQNSFSSTEKGTQGVFLIGAAFAAVGGIIAWTLVPDRERDLESEDAKFREVSDATPSCNIPRFLTCSPVSH